MRIEAENYRPGQQGVTYFDKTPGNDKGILRPLDSVDIYQSNDASGNYLVGWTETGEWLTYTVNVATDGIYNLSASIASALNGSMSLGVSVGGQQRTGQFSGTGGWTNWQSINVGQINLSAGENTVRVDISGGGFSFDYLDLVRNEIAAPQVSSSNSTPMNNPPQNPTPQSPQQPYQLGNVMSTRIGANTYVGSGGVDTIYYGQSSSAIIANLGAKIVTHKLPNSSNQPLKIMPLGDSITYGLAKTGDPGGYRDDLWHSLTGQGYNIDFVGPEDSGPDGFDKDHAGFPGWTIGDIAGSVNGWLMSYQPDKVLLTIGTNDIARGVNLGEAPTRLSNLIDQITSQLPKVQVLVATIPPIANYYPSPGSPLPQQVIQYNSAIPQIVTSKVAQGKNVTLVDVFGSIQQSDLGDGVHPEMAGNSRMAQTWYNALLGSNNYTDNIDNVENVYGSTFNDVLIGDSRDNILVGGGGDDLLTGGNGRDIFVLTPEKGTVRISDFILGQDTIALSNGLRFEQLGFTQATGSNFNDAVINSNGTTLAVLNGVQAGALTSNSFIVV